MHPLDLPLLADESVSGQVVAGLLALGLDVVDVADRGLRGATDRAVLACAVAEGRVVLTHDADFGALALRAGVAYLGVLYIRPGHIDSGQVLRQIAALRALDMHARPPFIVVAVRRGDQVRVRLRRAVRAAPPAGQGPQSSDG